MSSILINIPDISDADLIYDEAETRHILKFFWPQKAGDIDGMRIEHHARRLAQSALVAAIEGSYAMGFIHILSTNIIRPGSGIKSLARKLAKKYVKHWWKHTKQKDLEDVKIYESIRREISRQLRSRLEEISNGIATRRSNIPFFATNTRLDVVWA